MYISKHFTHKEVTCGCGCGFSKVSLRTLTYADSIREHEGKAVKCSSGCRCLSHNADVDGAPLSRHLPRPYAIHKGNALFQSDGMDLHLDDPLSVANWLDDNYPNCSYIVYDRFLHIDTRPDTYKKR